MRALLIGIDSGTQSSKALVVDASNGRVLGSSSKSYELIPDLRACSNREAFLDNLERFEDGRPLSNLQGPGKETGS